MPLFGRLLLAKNLLLSWNKKNKMMKTNLYLFLILIFISFATYAQSIQEVDLMDDICVPYNEKAQLIDFLTRCLRILNPT
jgi:hypothetical protein